VNIKIVEYERIKSEYCDKIQGLISELAHRRKENRDTTQIILQLEKALEEFLIFKRNLKMD
jgi:predicted patatin/cPLA2 family phospholipase